MNGNFMDFMKIIFNGWKGPFVYSNFLLVKSCTSPWQALNESHRHCPWHAAFYGRIMSGNSAQGPTLVKMSEINAVSRENQYLVEPVGFVKSPVELGKWRMWNRCFFKTKQISTGNHFEEEDFYPYELWNRQVSSGLIHLGPDIIWS